MDRAKNDQFILILVSLSCIGLTLESLLLNWEFWVPPLLIIGTVLAWAMHITKRPDERMRENCYFLYAMFAFFYHGIHTTSFFDVVVVYSLVIIVFSIMNRVRMIMLILAEYLVLMGIQIYLALQSNDPVMDRLVISRIILHIVIAVCVFFACAHSIRIRLESEKREAGKDDQIRANESDMEDFLSNISHELRTPVNVISGMSDLLIKKGAGNEAHTIKDAGIRLAGQIDDILDYTETRREDVILEEEDYMTTSLINDAITNFSMNEDAALLEMVVDVAPDIPTVMNGDIKKLHKIFRHLLSNAVKFTRTGGIFVKVYAEQMRYGVNLHLEVSDTGIGMGQKDASFASQGLYQANKKRNRSSGGVGLGLSIVYGFAHRMGGFVKIKSSKGEGTTVRVTIPQKVVRPDAFLKLDPFFTGDVLFHVRSDKFKVPRVRDFYRRMAVDLAAGIHVSLYPAETLDDVKHSMEKLHVKYIFMGEEEYVSGGDYFDELSRTDVVVVVCASRGFKPHEGSRVMVIPKPLYAYPVVKILNEGRDAKDLGAFALKEKPDLTGLRALVVDDEPMNLVVATGLFDGYGMITDTASSGAEAITKFVSNDYDVIFMEHMMPEMDGVECMHRIRTRADELDKEDVKFIVLTANVVSGAREMFVKEGFDGFIGKPISLEEFEKVMQHLFPEKNDLKGGGSI